MSAVDRITASRKGARSSVSMIRYLVDVGLFPARKVASMFVSLAKTSASGGTTSAAKTAAILALAAWTYSRIARLFKYLYPHSQYHPGTASWRALVDNPVIEPEEFEKRFIATAALSTRLFDFIIVGAGSAGCVLAARLAQDPNLHILLLEAGGEGQNARSVTQPNQALNLWRSEVDWGFRSTPQKHLLPQNRSVNLERGLTLGGSSSINWMLWVQGQKEDFDRWEKQFGCGPSWSWDACKHSYKRIETVAKGTFGGGAPAAHRGTSGGGIEPTVLHPPLREVDDFMAAFENVLGVGATSDYNSASQSGVGPMQYSTKGSRRSDAFTTFVEPLLRTRPNLTVASEGFVRRVVLDGISGDELRASGVELELNDGNVIVVRASREVILCAGAIGTPHILMHSGIGEKSHLESVGVKCKVDSPAVGSHLQDHPTVFVPALLKEPWDHLRQDSPGLHGIGFAQSPEDARIALEEGHPRGNDCEFVVGGRVPPQVAFRQVAQLLNRKGMELGAPDMYASKPVWRAFLSVAKKISETSAVKDKLSRLLILAGEMNHPESRGTVKLVSHDPHPSPLSILIIFLIRAICVS